LKNNADWHIRGVVIQIYQNLQNKRKREKDKKKERQNKRKKELKKITYKIQN
jgi:hypothetical protein